MGTHGWQLTVPCPVVKVLEGHGSQAVFPPEFAYVPATQSAQTLIPALGPLVPAAHGWHAEDRGEPVLGLNVPGLQLSHTLVLPSFVLYVPAAQVTHALRLELGAYVPAAQRSHTDLPVDELYFPRSQLRHVPEVNAPSVVLNFPVVHDKHMLALDRVAHGSLYVPAKH